MTFSRVATPQGRLFTNQISVVPLHGIVLGHVLINRFDLSLAMSATPATAT